MKEVTLPSGKILSIQLAPFEDSRELQSAVLDELKGVEVNVSGQMENLAKNLFCSAFSSKRVEKALHKCMERALYDGIKISRDTWEPAEARGDYMQACVEVAKENLLPFVKSLFAEYGHLLGAFVTDPVSKATTTPSS